MNAPDTVKDLVQRFETNRESYRSGKYNETQLRREFLDPLFEALGWDVFNKGGLAETYKDVIHEDSLEIEGERKAPDYAFRVGGQRKFFTEAKKPSVNIEVNIDPAFQLRRYAWSAKLPLSILTDFEEFAIYDCRVKPVKTDKASVGRIKLYSYKDYIEKWDEIASIFSRDAVLKGSFDSYAESTKTRKGTTEVDDAFLEEIERWRELLAKNIALRNQDLNVRELNYAVQMTIDRIVFLRICEDRGVERDEQLKEIGNPPPLSLRDISPKFDNKDFSKKEKVAKSNLGEESQAEGHVYEALCQLFKKADARYNSGLFHFQDEKDASSPTDSLTLNLKIDDKPLQDILKNLYYPESPYVFREIPADILGQVYERFLGKVIRLTPARQAKVEEKPEVRKAGGVYYTPTYIVNYIVENTVGKLLKGKTPKEAERLRILDPACGSGTFPLGAYQYLLDWHLKYYLENNPEKFASGKNPAIFQTTPSAYGMLRDPKSAGEETLKQNSRADLGEAGRGWKLTTSKKKDILLNNIYGVDIDPQAVEVTKLSLLLKVLEGESHETIGSQLALFQERVLPDLGKNIKCGNSLIGSDYYDGQQLTLGLVDEEERYRVNAFDWKAEFSSVFIQGGFDAVIGNPPWVFTKYVDWGEPTKDYIQSKYLSIQTEQEKSLARQAGKINLFAVFTLKGIGLLKFNGLFSFILPNNILRTTVYDVVRKQILENWKIQKIVDLKAGVFDGVTASTVILVIESAKPSEQHSITIIDNQIPNRIEETIKSSLNQRDCLSNPSYVLDIFSDDSSKSIISKMDSQSVFLGSLVDVLNGIATEKNMAGVLDKKVDKNSKPILFGKDIARYSYEWSGKHIDYVREKLLRARDENIFLSDEKLVMQRIGGILITAYDNQKYYTFNSVNNLLLKENTEYNLKFLLGIINSKLSRYYYISRFTNKSSLTVNISKTFLDNLPVRKINFSNSTEKAQHDKMVSLVERILALHKQNPKTPQEQERVKREIESTDKGIDKLVYELYGLSEEEIKIVEGKESAG